MKVSKECAAEAQEIYDSHVASSGFDAPETYQELMAFVEASYGLVMLCANAPDDFGLQVGEMIYVTDSPFISDRARMLILAHEWCHWLRREENCGYHFYSFDVVDEAEERDREEMIAIAFSRLF